MPIKPTTFFDICPIRGARVHQVPIFCENLSRWLTWRHVQTAEYFRDLADTCPGQMNPGWDGEDCIYISLPIASDGTWVWRRNFQLRHGPVVTSSDWFNIIQHGTSYRPMLTIYCVTWWANGSVDLTHYSSATLKHINLCYQQLFCCLEACPWTSSFRTGARRRHIVYVCQTRLKL